MPQITLDMGDAAALAEILTFLADWLGGRTHRCDVGSVAIARATRCQLGEVVEGDVPDDFDDELGREFGGGVV